MMNLNVLRRPQGVAQLEERDVGVLGNQFHEDGPIRRQLARAGGTPLRSRFSATAHRDHTRPSRTRGSQVNTGPIKSVDIGHSD